MVSYVNLTIFLCLILLFAIITLFIAKIIRFKDPKVDPIKLQTYECGEDPVGDAWIRFPVSFYLIALVFVLFDVEAAFIFPWILALQKLGLIAFIEMFIFLFILFLGWIYAFKKGALKWERNQ
ncbi:MAG: NADH-quinone oxidoreductase subunit A [Thermodesulfobacteriota bacterium]